MINLLPPDAKAEIRAGRVNRLLVRYLVLFTCLMLILFVAIGATLYTLYSTQASAEATIKQADDDSKDIDAQQKKVSEFQKNLSTAKQILDSQTSYSTVLTRIASVIPDDVIIDSLTISSASLNQPTVVNAYAKNSDAILELKKNLSKSKYFKNTHYTTISKASKGAYPFTITMYITFTSELFQ